MATTSAMSGKLEAEVELKSPPAKFFNVFRKAAHHIPTHTPSNVQAVKCHHGDWDRKPEVFKERVEFDEQKKIMKATGLEGDPMKIYKVFNVIYEFVSNNGGGGVVKLAIEYEKLDPNSPVPTKYMDLMVNLTKEIDAGLAKSD
ncbi:MLP-like protein 31 [Linum perenne]